jgi:hypothetical protein
MFKTLWDVLEILLTVTAEISVSADTYSHSRIFISVMSSCADPSGHAVEGVGLRPLYCWDCGFESRRGHGCLSCYVLSGGCLYVGLIPRPEESYRLWYDCDREASIMGRPWPCKGCCAMGEKMFSYYSGCGVREILLCYNQCSMYVYVTLFRLHISFGIRIC